MQASGPHALQAVPAGGAALFEAERAPTVLAPVAASHDSHARQHFPQIALALPSGTKTYTWAALFEPIADGLDRLSQPK